MSTPTTRERELERALNDVMLAAASFAFGRGMSEARQNLKDAIHQGNATLTSKPCERAPDLRELAERADAARAAQPGFRKDTDG